MEVNSRVISTVEKANGFRTVTGAAVKRPPVRRRPGRRAVIKRRPVRRRSGRRAVVRRRPGYRANAARRGAFTLVYRLSACAVAAVRGTLKFFITLATLVVSVFSGGPEVGNRVASAPRTSSRTAKEEACASVYDHNHDYGHRDATTEAKVLARNTVSSVAHLFWLGCPGPPNLIA